MDKAELELLARRAGLGKALRDHPEDVENAAEQAQTVASRMKPPASRTAEPWPPMRAGAEL